MAKKCISIAGIVLGAVMSFAGFLLLINGYSLHDPGYAAFGADFYTDIYEATRASVQVLQDVIEAINHVAGLMLLLGGLVVILIFVWRLADVLKSGQSVPALSGAEVKPLTISETKCAKCGAALSDHDEFCPMCGEKHLSK